MLDLALTKRQTTRANGYELSELHYYKWSRSTRATDPFRVATSFSKSL